MTRDCTPFHPSELHYLINLRTSGLSFSEMAQKVGSSKTTVRRRYNEAKGVKEDRTDENKGRPGRIAGAQPWPPTSDPWAVKVDFSAHDVKVKPTKRFVIPTQHEHVRSNVGCAAAMCADK